MSRKHLPALICVLFSASLSAQPPAIEPKVEALLKQMTLEEKVGQMTEVTIDVVSGPGTGRNHKLDRAKLEAAILKYHVGSILNVNGEAYTVEHWNDVINEIQDVAAKTRLKIPIIYGIDSVHGAHYTLGAALFPQSISVAATWNPELARRAGEISAWQTRASGIPWNYYPVLDIGRNPVWPRFWETLGEDVLLASRMGEAYIQGMQGSDMSARDKVAACLKHYAGYSLPQNGKDRTPAWIDERMMRQYVLPTFEMGVKAGVPTVMVNSGEINGVPGHANKWLLTDVLKGEWGFKGFVVSDWEDIKRLHTRDRVAATPKDAVVMAVMAGLDMSMIPMDFSFYDLLLEAAKEGRVPQSRIDDAVRRILRLKFQTGLFERPKADPAMKAAFHKPEFEQANLEAARESLVLLKNEGGFLPLKKGVKVLVTGPTADMLSVMNSGWTITWQGDQEQLYPKNKLTILRAIEQIAGKANVTYVRSEGFDKAGAIAEAVKAAQDADVIVAALGEKAYCETPGNIDDLTLDHAQIMLINALSKSGKPVVTVLAQGRPRVLRTIVPQSRAILLAMLPGEEGGRAIADVLFGEVNPSGKLPFTYPKSPNGFTTYDYKALENTNDNPMWQEFPFGYGLSYTTFEYSDLSLSAQKMTKNGSIRASISVKNTGSRAGMEVVQLYVSDLYRSISPPVKELKGFQKVDLAPGESKRIEFTLAAKDLAFVGLDYKWKSEPGAFKVRVANLEKDFALE